MSARIPIAALVSGIPSFVHGPELREGETQLQFLVKHHSQEWKLLIEYARNELGAQEHTCSLLQSLRTADITDPIIMSRVEGWANYRLPTHYRTLQSLVELRKMLKEEPGDMMSFDLVQILWPREKNPGGDTSAEKMASEMGAEVIQLDTGAKRDMDLFLFLPRVRGRYLWVLPGGSRFMAPLVYMSFRRVLNHMEQNEQVALYSDGLYSFICRVSALVQTAKRRGTLPADLRELGRVLHEDGFSSCGDSDPKSALCEIEEIYGGNYPFPRPVKTSWLGRLFGR